MHNECLVEALQNAAGSSPATPDVDDMVTTQPWADDLPVHVATAAGDRPPGVSGP
jgi:hypothetical protein